MDSSKSSGVAHGVQLSVSQGCREVVDGDFESAEFTAVLCSSCWIFCVREAVSAYSKTVLFPQVLVSPFGFYKSCLILSAFPQAKQFIVLCLTSFSSRVHIAVMREVLNKGSKFWLSYFHTTV